MKTEQGFLMESFKPEVKPWSTNEQKKGNSQQAVYDEGRVNLDKCVS